MKLSEEELKEELETQLRFLSELCEQFDKGDYKKSKLVASVLRKLLHDGDTSNPKSRSESLLGQLDLKNNFLDTALISKPVQMEIKKSESFLASSLLGNTTHNWKPVFDSNQSAQTIDFNQWWISVVIKDLEGSEFSRKKLVSTFANQDGGDHVDREVENTFYKLTRKNSMKNFTSPIPDGKLPERLDISKLKPVVSPAYYAVRQIAHEVLRSLKRDYNLDTNLYSGTSLSFIGLS